ncbi:zinc dependent phospholipase C family protein, partial [Caulobacter sp. 17J65-9]|uniref:zinc dependent phospholipase C family protein n=1 Tax=Caulobacter sp. 17J65-9 TaxID=2709382 RepID=UPI0013CD7EA3
MRTFKLKSARRGLLAGAAAAVMAAVAGVPTPALAWKPKTHVYLAEEALRDATDDGKVTIYETDYRTGRIIGVLGTFEVDAKILAALRAAPAQFRAGVLGPDAYPDILTGQQIIHPDEADSLDGGAGGSNGWLAHLWDRGFVNSSSPQVQAFTVGYLTHAAGDVFAHTYVNYYAGGEFMLTPDPTNAVKHLILEGYIGKRTPQTISSTTTRVRSGGPLNGRKRDDLGLDPVVGKDEVKYQDVNKPVTQEDTSIAGVERFIYDELTYAKPGSVLEAKLLKGDGTSRSIPYIFSRLRNGLQQQVDTYDRERMARSGPERVAYAALNGPAAEYKRAWIKDIDEGLAAFPAVSHEVAKAIVYNESGGDMGRAKAALGQYVEDHLAKMAGVPDAVVSVAAVIDGILPKFIADALHELMKAPIDVLMKGATGKTADEWEGYLTHPETNFDKVLNAGGGGHDGEVEHRTDLASFNRDQLKIADSGFSNPSLKWKIEDLPPAFNTVQMTKLLMLSDAGRQQLDTALKAKGGSLGAAPGRNPNLMLGWVRSLDAGNQWQGLPGKRAGASPRPAFSAGDAIAFQKLFLIQLGAKDIPGAKAPEHGASPAPAPAPAPPPT